MSHLDDLIKQFYERRRDGWRVDKKVSEMITPKPLDKLSYTEIVELKNRVVDFEKPLNDFFESIQKSSLSETVVEAISKEIPKLKYFIKEFPSNLLDFYNGATATDSGMSNKPALTILKINAAVFNDAVNKINDVSAKEVFNQSYAIKHLAVTKDKLLEYGLIKQNSISKDK
jgi:hypothetical protein